MEASERETIISWNDAENTVVGGVVHVESEIRTLHSEILGHYKTSIEKAIRIGELLQQKKAELPHGQFIRWVKTVLPFNRQTAASYMRVFDRRDELKRTTVVHLKDAYKMLSLPELKKQTVEQICEQVDRELPETWVVIHRSKLILNHLDEIPDPGEQIRLCKNVLDDLGVAYNKAAEITLQCEFKLGESLNELQRKAPAIYPLIADDPTGENSCKVLQMIEARVKELEQVKGA